MDRHDTLLIVSSDQAVRTQLRSSLGERFHMLEASGVQQTGLLLKQNLHCIAAVVIHVQEEIRRLQEDEEMLQILKALPVIAVGKNFTDEQIVRSFVFGAADVIQLSYEPYAMLRRIENIVDLHLHKQHLENMVKEQSDVLRRANERMVDALSAIIEYRSVESGQHVLRIRHFTRILLEEVARSCPEYNLTESDINNIASASALHDIGKIAIPDAILLKPGKLTAEEFEVMKTHSLVGSQILETLADMGDPVYMRYAHNICHYHHERWDGKGYPEGLAGDDIPICAQVVGLADCYDALTSKRVYKDAFSFTKAVNMILRGECGVFSEKLLECFKQVIRSFESLAKSYADGMSPKNESFDLRLPVPSADAVEGGTGVDRIRAKYYALVHYINGFLMEVDLTRGMFHLIYNPYPDIAPFHQINTLEEATELLKSLVIQEERQQMEAFLDVQIPEFVDQDNRRKTLYFHLRSTEGADLFEITLLRIHNQNATSRSLALLCRKMSADFVPAQQAQTAIRAFSDSTLVCRNDEGFTLLSLGEGVSLLAGYTPQEIRKMGGRLLDLILPEDREATRMSFYRQFRSGTVARAEFRCRRKDGSILWVRDTSMLHIGTNGEEYLNVQLMDITGLKQEADELHRRLEHYEIILSQTENVLFDWDLETDTAEFSDTWENIFGIKPQGVSIREAVTGGSYFHPDDLPLLIDALNALEQGSAYESVEVRMSNAMGRYLWCRFRANAVREGGKLKKIVGILINIDQEKRAQRQLLERADRDSLTKLLNKNACRKQAEEYLSRFSAGADCALLIIDLDNFKQINDHYGHLFGDTVLTKAAREIENLFRAQDIVGRIGGDEFLVLVRGSSDRRLLESRCQRLLNIFANTFRNQKQRLPLGCSIGIALCPEHGTNYYDLFNHADQALYRSKARGKDCYTFYDGTVAEQPVVKSPNTAVSTSIDSDEEPSLTAENIVRFAFQKLYAAQDEDAAINEILAMVGQRMNVSRVYVFENSEDNRFCSNTYEWCNKGTEPEIGNLQNISYETDIPDYWENFDEQGIFYCPDIRVLPQKTRDIVEPQGIKSMLHCAIRDQGVFRGYIGFDECVEQRLWTKEQITTLSYFSDMLSVFLQKKRQREKDQQRAADIYSVLDNQNAWIYIIDPDSCRLKYLNKKTRELAPAAQPGMYCYKALKGLEERCPGCPAADIHRDKTCVCTMHNQKFDLNIHAEATLIQWEGVESCLLTCRKLPS